MQAAASGNNKGLSRIAIGVVIGFVFGVLVASNWASDDAPSAAQLCRDLKKKTRRDDEDDNDDDHEEVREKAKRLRPKRNKPDDDEEEGHDDDAEAKKKLKKAQRKAQVQSNDELPPALEGDSPPKHKKAVKPPLDDRVLASTSLDDIYVSPALAITKQSGDSYWEKLVDSLSDVRSSGLFVEVGSYDGEQAARAIGRGLRLIVMEPSPTNFKRVEDKLRSHIGRSELTLLNAAGTDVPGEIEMWTIGGSGDFIPKKKGDIPPGEARNYREENTVKVKIPGLRVDDVVGDRSVYVLKIDTQGHDYKVMLGAKRLFEEKRIAVCIVEFHPTRVGRETAIKMLKFFKRYDYDMFFMGNMSVTMPVFQDEWLASPQGAEPFVDSFSPFPMFGLGQFTDVVAVCRTCAGRNILGALTDRQRGVKEPAHPLLKRGGAAAAVKHDPAAEHNEPGDEGEDGGAAPAKKKKAVPQKAAAGGQKVQEEAVEE